MNVPDDWGSYYRRCDLCGRRYHASEGGCDCTDDLDDCPCGQRDWASDCGVIYCRSCMGHPGEERADEPEEDDDES